MLPLWISSGVQRFRFGKRSCWTPKKFPNNCHKMMKPTSTVLIVDDQPSMRDVLKRLLRNQGYELAFATNGQEALTKAAELIPDVILLDVMMPIMDGFEVCRRLRADSTLAQVPILMVTSLKDRDSRLRGIKAGADDFVSKPYDIFELRARIETISKLNRYRRLLTEQAKFEWVIDNSDEAYLIISNNNQIVYTNSKARLYLNLPTNKDEPINETFLEVVAKQYHQMYDSQSSPLPIDLTQKKIPRYLVRPDTETAQAFWLRVDVMEMSSESDEKLLNLRNITDTILANRQRWTLQSQISHKLRTPLTIIRTSQYVLENFAELTKEEIKKWLERIDTGGSRLQTEIEEILEYMNMSTMAQTTREPCNVNDLLLNITTIKDRLNIESVHVSQQEIENPNTFVRLSCWAIEVILTEIFSNAKKFHPKGTPILELSIVTLSSDAIRLRISDDGVTLSPEQLDKMWMPYYQGEKYFTGEKEGMGVGLSMVASLIWEVEGTCHAYNRTEKKGVVIELTLPLVK